MRKYYVSFVMRLAARLKIEIHKLSGSTTASSLEDYLTPANFDTISKAALKVARQDEDDEDNLAAPSNAIKLSHDFKRLAGIKLAKGNPKRRQ